LSIIALCARSLPLSIYESISSSKRFSSVSDANFTGYTGDSVRLLDNDPNCYGFFFQVYVTHLDGHLYLAFPPLPFVSSNSCVPYLYDSRQFEQANETVGVFRHISEDDWAALKNTSYLVGPGYRYLYDVEYVLRQVDAPVEGEYDIVTNNCAVRLIQALNLLDFTVDQHLMDYCKEQLLQSQGVIDLLRASPNLSLLFPNTSTTDILAMSDDTLMQTLISYTVTSVQGAGSAVSGCVLSALLSLMISLMQY